MKCGDCMSAKQLRKLALLLSVILLIFLLFLTGTHASESYSELKTSSLTRTHEKNKVEIIDQFDKLAAGSWDMKTSGDGSISRTLKIKNIGNNPVFI